MSYTKLILKVFCVPKKNIFLQENSFIFYFEQWQKRTVFDLFSGDIKQKKIGTIVYFPIVTLCIFYIWQARALFSYTMILKF
jgi:hypothetical protein